MRGMIVPNKGTRWLEITRVKDKDRVVLVVSFTQSNSTQERDVGGYCRGGSFGGGNGEGGGSSGGSGGGSRDGGSSSVRDGASSSQRRRKSFPLTLGLELEGGTRGLEELELGGWLYVRRRSLANSNAEHVPVRRA
ncbi:hypothetical protein V1477_003627 [Vespula maculifrons]|uniref:Uncharacterized protein n=1 Tax=Vespula maculifrons TaxID=7453 RepID=A0ABD2CTD3_VESMC